MKLLQRHCWACRRKLSQVGHRCPKCDTVICPTCAGKLTYCPCCGVPLKMVA